MRSSVGFCREYAPKCSPEAFAVDFARARARAKGGCQLSSKGNKDKADADDDNNEQNARLP
jgi:hypothetical protein